MFASITRLALACALAPLAACEEAPDFAAEPGVEARPTGLLLATQVDWGAQIRAVRFKAALKPCPDGPEPSVPWASEATLVLSPGHTPEVFFEAPAGCYTLRAEVLGEEGATLATCAAPAVEVEHDGIEDLEVVLAAPCRE
jgi:hypothetical protein